MIVGLGDSSKEGEGRSVPCACETDRNIFIGNAERNESVSV